MKEKYIQILGIFLSAVYFAGIVWLYANEPKTFQEAATKATVTAGTYEVDRAKFDEGLRYFRQDNFIAATLLKKPTNYGRLFQLQTFWLKIAECPRFG